MKKVLAWAWGGWLAFMILAAAVVSGGDRSPAPEGILGSDRPEASTASPLLSSTEDVAWTSAPYVAPPEPIYVAPPEPVYVPPVGGCAENGSCYGDLSVETGRAKTVHVDGYYRRDGTYVRGHYRSPPRY